MLTAATFPSASDLPNNPVETIGLFVLLDFLTGDSLDDVAKRHRLQSRSAAEALIRVVLLKHGFRVN